MRVILEQTNVIIKLPGPKRFEHFVKRVVDLQVVWGLYQDGWALAATDDGEAVFPLWPSREYAELCALNEWVGYESQSIKLDEFMEDLLPKLKSDGILPGVFYTPVNKGVTPSVDELLRALEAELSNY